MTFHDCIKKTPPAVKTGETAYFQNREGLYYDSIPYVRKKVSVPVRREVMCEIENFVEEAPPGKSPLDKMKCFFLWFIFLSWQNTQNIDMSYGGKVTY